MKETIKSTCTSL